MSAGLNAWPWPDVPEVASVYPARIGDRSHCVRITFVLQTLTAALVIAESEHDHAGGFLDQYWEILSNPAHMAVEITLMFLIDVILLGLLWPLVRRFIDAKLHRQHELFDREHGIHHHGDHVHIDPEIMHPQDEHPEHA